jgi:hypothetical protein
MSTTTTITREETQVQYDLTVPRGPIETELTFYVPPSDGSVPFNYVESPPAGQPQRNYNESKQRVTVDDIRGHESEYTLDRDAFQVFSGVSSATSYETFNNDDDVKRTYYPEVEQFLIDNVPGVHKVILFDHTIRREKNVAAGRGPVNRAHSDQTDRATEWRVRLHVEDPDEAERLLKGRYRIINVWRPLNGSVQSSPLAVASAASVKDTDLVAVQHRYPTRTGETMGVIYNPDLKWKYWSGMDNDERILLKCSDNQPDVGKRCPHTAFVDSRTPQNAKPRESIEVRALVFG